MTFCYALKGQISRFELVAWRRDTSIEWPQCDGLSLPQENLIFISPSDLHHDNWMMRFRSSSWIDKALTPPIVRAFRILELLKANPICQGCYVFDLLYLCYCFPSLSLLLQVSFVFLPPIYLQDL